MHPMGVLNSFSIKNTFLLSSQVFFLKVTEVSEGHFDISWHNRSQFKVTVSQLIIFLYSDESFP